LDGANAATAAAAAPFSCTSLVDQAREGGLSLEATVVLLAGME
jgi:hypothetical protein